MKIVAVETRAITLRLGTPYRTACETIDHTTNVLLDLHTDTGLTGRGCAAPSPLVTGEDAATTERALRELAEPCLHGADPTLPALLLETVRGPLKSRPSAVAAVDLALHDLLGKRAGLPLYEILGGCRRSMPTSITIGILPAEDTVEKARAYVARGFVALKLKGGLDVDGDIERVWKVREAVGPPIALRFDANQGFTASEALRFVAETNDADLELLEQPTPREQLDELGKVTTGAPIPVMADESLLTLRDAFKLASRKLVNMINIKLMKVGGLAPALQINGVARSAGLDVMVGCMDECALSIAAGLHLALARPNIGSADLDGHVELVDDPTANAVVLRDGVLYPTGRPGLGWE